MPPPARATATVSIGADWTEEAVEAIRRNNEPVLNVIEAEGTDLVLRVSIDDLQGWVGIGQAVPAEYDEQERLVLRIVTELLQPISELPETRIEISDLVIG
jgi:predicted Zn-dependent protease